MQTTFQSTRAPLGEGCAPIRQEIEAWRGQVWAHATKNPQPPSPHMPLTSPLQLTPRTPTNRRPNPIQTPLCKALHLPCPRLTQLEEPHPMPLSGREGGVRCQSGPSREGRSSLQATHLPAPRIRGSESGEGAPGTQKTPPRWVLSTPGWHGLSCPRRQTLCSPYHTFATGVGRAQSCPGCPREWELCRWHAEGGGDRERHSLGSSPSQQR